MNNEPCDACFEESKGMVRYSTAESDCYWELAEHLMELTAKRLGTTIHRETDADVSKVSEQVEPE